MVWPSMAIAFKEWNDEAGLIGNASGLLGCALTLDELKQLVSHAGTLSKIAKINFGDIDENFYNLK